MPLCSKNKFQPIKNQVDRFSNWWRELFKEEMIKDIRG